MINLEAVYTGEVWSPFKGAVRDAPVHLHNLDLTAQFPGETLGMPGTSAFVYGLGNAGLDPSE